jgi:NNP family nitrate/nitrite transporter-like MFS transporter
MKQIIDSLKSGNWKALLACFLYFDTGFTVWVMLGPLAPFISKDIAMTPAQQGFLVAVPVLSAAILRVTWGNLFQSVDGKKLALIGIILSALPAAALPLMSSPPSYTMLALLGVFLGMGGASFAVALPMAGSNYPPKVQGLVLGLAAAGNIGAVLDGFLFPGIAQHYGWMASTAAALPLLALSAAAMIFWASDLSPKATEGTNRAWVAFGVTFVTLIALVLLVKAGVFGDGKTGLLLLPPIGAAVAIALLPSKYRAVLAERDTWVMNLVYSITFGGFVGMSSYVTLLLTTQYGMAKIDAGLLMSAFAFTGAVIRPIGGALADRVTGVRALLVLLAAISLFDFTFALVMPGLAGGIALIFCLYVCFGLGNGATFQLVPQRWKGKTGVMTGIIGCFGGIGGFYLPVIMGIARESTGSYAAGFATFGGLSLVAFGLVVLLRQQWMSWAVASDTVIAGSELDAAAAHAE